MYSGACVTTPIVHVIAVTRVPWRRYLTLIPALLMLLLPPQAAIAADAAVPNQILIKFKQKASVIGVEQALAARPGQRQIAERLHRVEIQPGETVEQVIHELEALPEVEYAEPNYIRRLQQLSPPNDPNFGNQWALHNTGQSLPIQQDFPGQPGVDISALEAWAITTGSPDVIVAVIDSGIDRNHPELIGNLWSDALDGIGRDFIDGDNEPNDTAGHGTRMAGIIGARGGNGIGIAGVSWNVSLMSLRAFNAEGEGTVADIVAAIDYAIANGARIINASFGANRFAEAESDAIRRAANAGILVVAAACNDAADNDISNAQQQPCYPASYDLPNVISVAATDNTDALMPESNYGATSVDLGAPGQHILTTTPQTGGAVNNPYVFVSGTSASAAFVSGAAALLLAQNPLLDAALLRDALLENVDPAQNLAGRTVTGGRLNVAKALESEAAHEQSTGASLVPTGSSGAGGWYELLVLLASVLLLHGARMRRHRACSAYR